jgi:hypothetical protein
MKDEMQELNPDTFLPPFLLFVISTEVEKSGFNQGWWIIYGITSGAVTAA